MILHPFTSVETVGLATAGDQILNAKVFEAIINSKATSMSVLYALKWRVFTLWSRNSQLGPVNCLIRTVLEILQDRFSSGLSPSTLKVYMVATATFGW